MFAGQADGLCELGVDVDRVEVARRARVAVRQVLVGSDLQLGIWSPGDSLDSASSTMLVQVPRATSAPSWFFDTDSNT